MCAAVRQIGEIFNVRNVAEQLVSEIQNDFEIAEQSVKSLKTELKAIWLDCVDCCTDETGEKTGLYVGAGTGAPNLIMQEAGMKNVFAGTDGSWTCATASDILAAKPDVMIIVDAAWDTAMSKIDFLHNHSDFCDADFVKGADYISIPFSASTLGPRNGAAALDMALAAIHVTTGSTTVDFKSGVNFISPDALEKRTVGLRCPVDASSIKYSENREVTYASCGVQHTLSKTPSRVVTMNQGVTEFIFAMGLADKMVGTAYLDDAIWPKYADAYKSIPVLSSSYPDEATIMGAKPTLFLAHMGVHFARKLARISVVEFLVTPQ